MVRLVIALHDSSFLIIHGFNDIFDFQMSNHFAEQVRNFLHVFILLQEAQRILPIFKTFLQTTLG